MKLRPVKKRRRRPGDRQSLGQYLRARKATLLFFGIFLAGLTAGSFYACVDGSGSMVLISIVINSVKLQQTLPFFRIFLQCATQVFGILVYLYFAAYCMKGKWLIYMTPLVFGLSVGAITTSVLYRFGLSGFLYVLLCLFVPKFLELLLLVVLCNACLRISAGVGMGTQVKGDIFWMFAIFFAVFAFVEGLLLFHFCALLPLNL